VSIAYRSLAAGILLFSLAQPVEIYDEIALIAARRKQKK